MDDSWGETPGDNCRPWSRRPDKSESDEYSRLRPGGHDKSETFNHSRLRPRRHDKSETDDYSRLRPGGCGKSGSSDTQDEVNGDLDRVNDQGQGPNIPGQDTPTGGTKGPARQLLQFEDILEPIPPDVKIGNRLRWVTRHPVKFKDYNLDF
jgi:hypothetical protein